MSPIELNLQHVRAALDAATLGGHGKVSKPIFLLAVSKTQSADTVREAFSAGQRAFGENYVQEGVAKIRALADLRASGIEWHLIGPLQSNKARLVAQHFDWVHGIDRLKIAEALSRLRDPSKPLNVCIQVNISQEASKSGVSPAEVLALALAIRSLPNLKLRGLMTIIEHTHDASAQREQFRQMRQLQSQLLQAGLAVDTLSMGMSQDFQVAIEEGATMVRIGRAIFGERH
ncbi:MAG: YggS family pyridoxal phosphate-dependent enzyme [Betaproteobacteria bacterium]|nr:YggS family pyridoxal phosphate-dependent enzyme [Betaproteobacteria bacterium]